MLQYMFGTPFYKTKIESEDYEKSKIISQIEQNYNVDPNRNQWDGTNSELHHSYNDNQNDKFVEISYESLIPLYKQKIVEFLDFYFNVRINYNFYIVNYTCVGKGHHMRVHNHPNSCFSGVHYIKFNKQEHRPTVYHNPSDWAYYTDTFFSRPMYDSHSNVLKHSWLRQTFELDIEEDDLVITPSTLRHNVPVSYSEDLRMVIVFHIDINEIV